MSHITGWGWYWIVWIFAGFLVPELYAVFTNIKNTLSWQVWGIENFNPNLGHPFDFADWTWTHWTIGSMVLVFCVWLFIHMAFGLVR